MFAQIDRRVREMRLRNLLRLGCLPCLLLGLWSSPVDAANERALEALKYYAPELAKDKKSVKKFLRTRIPPPKSADETVLRALFLAKTPMKTIIRIMEQRDDDRDDAAISRAILKGGGGIPDKSPFWGKRIRKKGIRKGIRR